jgi:hypothetical protein
LGEWFYLYQFEVDKVVADFGPHRML